MSENNIVIYPSKNNFEEKERGCPSKFIFIGIGAILLIAIIIFIIFFVPTPPNSPTCNECSEPPSPPPNNPITPSINVTSKLESEFTFNTKVHDLKLINIDQITYEIRMIDNQTITLINHRITNYLLYVISEANPNEDEINFYDKMYTIAISIQSECYSNEKESCVPQKLVDLTNSDNDEETESSEEIDDLKDIPVPLCLFNITNNDVVTSITCHKSIPEHKRRLMVLDIYFFRPPAIKRIEKEKSNITITYTKLDDNKTLITETNGGICDVVNAYNTFCSTEMNTTIDSESNILKYEEIAYMIVVKNQENSYEKNKITKLIDETSKISSFPPEKYEESLNKLLSKLEPHFTTDILFTKQQFEEVYIASKKGVEYLKIKLKRRKLKENEKIVSKEGNLLNYDSDTGAEFKINLLIISGLYSLNAESIFNFNVEDNKRNIVASKESSFNYNIIINKLITLSDAGNYLVKEIEKINNTFDSIVQEVNEKITNLNSLVVYNDFSEIFDSTLSLDSINVLPITIIQEIINLKNKLTQILNEIKNGGMKTKLNILNKNIYEYTRDSHNLLYELFDNFNQLTESLSSKKSKITEISTYFLNHTTFSVFEIIKTLENILNNYYKIEYDLITPQINSLIKNFEDNLIESLQKESKIINNLYKNIDTKVFTVHRAGDEEYKMILLNLNSIKGLIDELINTIKEKITKEMEIKDSGYFISNYEINSNNNSFYNIIQKGLNIAKILDNDEFIDKIFIQIMTNFKGNITETLKNMDKKKEELFSLNEDVLRESSFTTNDLNNIENNISYIGVNILNKIIEENDDYKNEINQIINKLANNKDYLFNLMTDLTILFSENLSELANLYEIAFNSCLEKINNELLTNELLTNQYFNDLETIINDKTKIKELIKGYHTELIPEKNRGVPFKEFEDSITSESITNGYLTKYNTYKANFAKSKKYINDQLYKDLLLEYKKPIVQIRELLYTLKNNKLSEKYLDLKELSFIDEHIKIIDDLYDRLNKKISDEIFNNEYVNKIKSYKTKMETKFSDINTYIETKNSIIDRNDIVNEHINDFCFTFQRKITYSCVNGVWNTLINSDYYCISSSYKTNHLQLVEHSIDSDGNLQTFINKYNSFISLIKEKVNSYNEKIIEFKNSQSSLEKNTINKKIVSNDLLQINTYINSLLNIKYGNEIIKNSYNYYQNNIEGIIENLLNNITFQWEEIFDTLYDEVNNNLLNFKNSIIEFGQMSGIYISLITQTITKTYFNSIVNHQQNEFNYTIKYYYNHLLKSVQSTYQYIIHKLPINKIGFNNILDDRKKEINEFFTSLIENIKNYENDSLSFDKQINILKVPKTNFFKINKYLTENILATNNSLTTKMMKLNDLRNNLANNEISLTVRFYLENYLNGKEVEEIYEEINKKVFVYLDLERFKNLLIENWIFDQDDFIKQLKITLYNYNLEISQEFATLKEEYSILLENQITRYFTKAQLENNITELYNSQVKELENSQIEGIKQNIIEILTKIKEHLSNEAIRINSTANSYNKDYTQIQNRLEQYKNEIFNKLKNTIFKIIDDFHQNMINKVYNDYIVENLNQYIIESKKFTSNFQEQQLLNSSYKLGEIIDEFIEDYVNEYKSITKRKIDSKYIDYSTKIKNKVNIDDLQKLINNEISQAYNSILYPILKENEKFNSNDAGYNQYDFNDDIKNDIESTINSKINEIAKIMDTTKGNNYQVTLNADEWEILDYTNVYDDVLLTIENSFNEFIMVQLNNEENNFNQFLQNIFKLNFNNLLKNIIPSFGNDFFERIIQYNENFKISSLYNNLKYLITQTILYYNSLYSTKKISAITRDLKLKIYSLNNLDSIVENRNKEVLNLLETKVNEFIIESQEYIIREYKSMIETDLSIELNFNELIYRKVKENINLVQDELEKDYILTLNNYFKNQLIESYTNVMNTKANELLRILKNEREMLKSQIDDLFTIQTDDVLNDINLKINNTLDSIEKFNSHLKNNINIPNELITYLNSYGGTKIQPVYESLINFLNYETKDKIILNINKNSQQYEQKLNLRDFIEKSNNLYLIFGTNYIDPIKENINNYGINEYPTNLENEINRQNDLKNRRRIEEENEMINQEKIADQSIDDIFKNLLSSSNNTKIYINTFKKFSEFDDLITKYINKVNTAYKTVQKRIIDNDYEDQIKNSLNDSLKFLYQISLDYYKQINQSYYRLKNYLIESINDINTDLNECANITYITFKDKYNSIANEVEPFDREDYNISEQIQDTFNIGNQNQIIIINYKILNMTKKSKFKYNMIFEGLRHNVSISINNENRPKKMLLELITPEQECGKTVEYLEIEFNDVNYTMNIDYSTKSTDINLQEITNFNAYIYNKEIYQIEEVVNRKCWTVAGTSHCYNEANCNDNDKKIISNKRTVTIPKKENVENFIIKN